MIKHFATKIVFHIDIIGILGIIITEPTQENNMATKIKTITATVTETKTTTKTFPVWDIDGDHVVRWNKDIRMFEEAWKSCADEDGEIGWCCLEWDEWLDDEPKAELKNIFQNLIALLDATK